MKRRFDMVDVFGSGPVSGNPLAVVHDADGLSTDDMQAITRWLNLSETTFLVSPTSAEADYHVRIFTLISELPFAGHPTLGTCHSWLAAGGQPKRTGRVVQECGAGLVQLTKKDLLAFAAPGLLREGEVDAETKRQVLAVLGVTEADIVDIVWADNGPGWIGVLFPDHDSVLALQPDIGRYTGTGQIDIGVVGPHPTDSDVDFEVRAFFSNGFGQILEDPVTGSLNASLGQWLIGSGRAADSYLAAQGTAIGRAGRVHVSRDEAGDVWVGGTTETLVQGEIDF
ncbi:MAG: PhzF family phenazine biosynthesis protein [Acidimicrobiia bacterium]